MNKPTAISIVFIILFVAFVACITADPPRKETTKVYLDEVRISQVNPNEYPQNYKDYYRKESVRQAHEQELLADQRKQWAEFCSKGNVDEQWYFGQAKFSCTNAAKIPKKNLQ